MDGYQQSAETLRALDRDRYLADLFVPAAARPHVMALHAFNAEIARIRDTVSQPLPGEIRLQWWRDAILNRDAGGNPLAVALIDTIDRFALPLAAFDNLIEARIFDLYDDPMPSLNDLEGYLGETTSILFQLAAMIAAADGEARAVAPDPGTADIAGHAGVALGIANILRALPVHAARHQLYLPADLLAAEGVDTETVFAGKPTPPLIRVLAELRAIARGHLKTAEEAARTLPPALRPVFLPLTLVTPELTRLEKGANPFAPPAAPPPWQTQWRLWRAARRG